MRLIQSRLKDLPLSRPETIKSDYIGSKTTYKSVGTIRAEIQHISAHTTAEQYGITISRGILIFCELGTDIKERDHVRWQNADYSVVSVFQHNNVIRAEGEKVQP